MPGEAIEDGGLIMPQMNVPENDNEVRITAEVPGVSEKDIEVTLDGDVLTIRSEKKHEEKGERADYRYVERPFGSFQRSLQIPHSVKTDQVQARVENDVLTVTLPKNPDKEKARHIQVQGGGK